MDLSNALRSLDVHSRDYISQVGGQSLKVGLNKHYMKEISSLWPQIITICKSVPGKTFDG
jgi:hypothetical protein